MAIDVKRILRLRSTIAAGTGTKATSALIALYSTARAQVLAMLDGDLAAEFEELFPAWSARRGGGVISQAVSSGVTLSEARGRLSAIVSWLDGLVQGLQIEAQTKANADAYARERVRQERGMGFRADAGDEPG